MLEPDHGLLLRIKKTFEIMALSLLSHFSSFFPRLCLHLECTAKKEIDFVSVLVFVFALRNYFHLNIHRLHRNKIHTQREREGRLTFNESRF